MRNTLILLSAVILVLASCSKDEIEPRVQEPATPHDPQLIFQFNFDNGILSKKTKRCQILKK